MRFRINRKPCEQRLIGQMADAAMDCIEQFGAADHGRLRDCGFPAADIRRYGSVALTNAIRMRPVEVTGGAS